MHILSLSDVVEEEIYNPAVRERFPNIDLIIGCGDLPYYYLEYVQSTLNTFLYFVRGNHEPEIEYGTGKVERRGPPGGFDLHRRVIFEHGLLMAGVEGSIRYREGLRQYTQTQMWLHVIRLVPGLIENYVTRGRFLDIFVTHSPPWRIHDSDDPAHRGIKAFRWLLATFRPAIHFHGHVQPAEPRAPVTTIFHHTRVINTYGYLETSFVPGSKQPEVLT